MGLVFATCDLDICIIFLKLCVKEKKEQGGRKECKEGKEEKKEETEEGN